MGVAEVEGQGELLVWAGGIGGRDAGDEGTGMAGKVEAGFGAHGLDELDCGLDGAPARGVGRGRGTGDVLGANAQDDGLA